MPIFVVFIDELALPGCGRMLFTLLQLFQERFPRLLVTELQFTLHIVIGTSNRVRGYAIILPDEGVDVLNCSFMETTFLLFPFVIAKFGQIRCGDAGETRKQCPRFRHRQHADRSPNPGGPRGGTETRNGLVQFYTQVNWYSVRLATAHTSLEFYPWRRSALPLDHSINEELLAVSKRSSIKICTYLLSRNKWVLCLDFCC